MIESRQDLKSKNLTSMDVEYICETILLIVRTPYLNVLSR
jgi:hypothetical protein